MEVEGNDMLIIVVNIRTTKKKKQLLFLKTYARGMDKKKRPIVEVDGGEMSVRGEHIARGSCVLEVPQIRVRTRLILMPITMVMVVKNIFQLKTFERGGRVLEVPQIRVRPRLRWDLLAFQVLVVQLCGPSP